MALTVFGAIFEANFKTQARIWKSLSRETIFIKHSQISLASFVDFPGNSRRPHGAEKRTFGPQSCSVGRNTVTLGFKEVYF